jgi:hypothetical protein
MHVVFARRNDTTWLCYIALCLGFAMTYRAVSACDPTAFATPLSTVDAIYFSIVTQSTVGFGDVAPKRGYARAIAAAHIASSVYLLLKMPGQ